MAKGYHLTALYDPALRVECPWMSSPTHTPMFCTKAIGLPPGIPDQHEGGLRSIQKLARAARTHESGLVQEIGLKYDRRPPD